MQPQPGFDPLETLPEGASRSEERRLTPFLAPVPFKNTQIGWGLFLMLGVIHHFSPDTTLKPSTGAVGGFYTENESWGLMGVEMARLAGDRWRLRGGLSHMDVRYDFYGIGEDAGAAGQKVGLRQTIDFGLFSALGRVAPGIYLGGSVLGMQTRVELRDPLFPSSSPPSEDLTRTSLFAPGLNGELDTRDSDYWPTHGSLAKLKGLFFTRALGGSREFQRYTASWSWYTRLRGESMILALNANASAAAGDAPFYVLPSVGAGAYGLRGYTQGRYRDKVMATVQGESRFHTSGRLGATVFAGMSQVAPTVGDLTKSLVLPAGGAGLRYQVTRQYPMHLRFDYAWGRDGSIVYFSIAEAF